MSVKPSIRHILRLRRSKTPLDRSGFTLLEMMIVLGVIAILASLAAPSVTRMKRRETAREFANAVANQLRIARMQAKTQGIPLLVTITPGDATTQGNIEIFRGTPYCRSSLNTTPGTNGLCDDHMKPKPPMSCAELNSRQSSEREEFRTNETPLAATLQSLSADDYIAGTSGSTAEGPVTLCFSPDGRILAANGQTLSDPRSVLCSGENFLVYTASHYIPAQRTYSKSLPELASCTTTPATNDTTSAARDEVNLFRITLPYNGAIHVSQ